MAGWSEQLNEISLLLELPWAMHIGQADPDSLLPHPWASQSQNSCGRWVVAGQPINKQLTEDRLHLWLAEMVEEAKLPCPAGFRTFRLKENNRCSFKKKNEKKNKPTNPKHNFITKIHASEYLENKNIFASSHRVSGRRTERRIYIFLISITFPWWTPESVRHCLGMSHRGVFKASSGYV